MADPDFEFMDGFDKYGPYGIASDTNRSNMLSRGEWTSVNIIDFQPSLYGPGYSFRANGSCQKQLPNNYQRCIGGIYFKSTSNSWPSYVVRLVDGSTIQCAITAEPNVGTITARRNSNTANAIFTTAAGTYAYNTVNCLEWDITVHNTAGIVKVWLNGTLIINQSGVNTRGSANNYYNRIEIADNSGQFDHFYSWHYLASGGSETPALTNPIIVTDAPNAADTSAFAIGAATMGDFAAQSSTSWTSNRMYLRKVRAEASGNLTAINVYFGGASATAKIKTAVFADASGAPGAPLGSSAEVIGVVSGVNTFNLSASVAVVAGTDYWIGWVTDTVNLVVLYSYGSGDTGSRGAYFAQTYASALPNPPTGVNYLYNELCIWGTVTGVTVNWPQVNEIPHHEYSYNSSSTVGAEDLFGFPALPFNPSAIYSVAVKGVLAKSDTGVRTVDLRLKSSGTTYSGSNTGITPAITPNWASTHFRKNPNGGAAWTRATVEAAKIGYKIAS